ncbi:hypothetical protein V3C99_002739 [Haemonchus contortus]|uniref:Receptor expression-enhancing protein n=1 Tax=Haemonchus contortus TaxID=6289 RepID=W6NM04_HAECO
MKSASSDAPPSSAGGGGGANPVEGIKKAHADMVAWCYKPHGAADEQLKKIDAAGVKREHIVYGLIGLISLYLIAGEGAMFVSYLVTFFYPASVAVEAVRNKKSDEAVNQLQYWIFFGFFALLDSTAIALIAAWYFLKTVFLVFLFLPQTQGSALLFQKVVEPIARAIDGITKKN